MSDFAKAVDTHVNEADWERMAANAGMSVTDLKNKIIPAMEAEAAGRAELLAAPAAPQLRLAAVTRDGDCSTQSFEVSLFKIIGVSGELTLCGTTSRDWSAELKTCLVAAGAKVWCTSYKFDPHNLGVSFSPNVGVAKATLCFALQIGHGKVCLNIKGKACAWALGWRCDDFDVTPFCIPLP